MHTEQIRIQTGAQERVHDLTKDCRAFLDRVAAGDGLLHVWVPHATRSRELLKGSAVIAGCSGATRLMLKTYVEAVRIPTVKENGISLRLVRDALDSVTGGEIDLAAVEAEEELINAEVTAGRAGRVRHLAPGMTRSGVFHIVGGQTVGALLTDV